MPGNLAICQKFRAFENGVAMAESNEESIKSLELSVLGQLVPQKPIQFIVLAPGVVIAISGVSIFISHEQHRCSYGQNKSCVQIPHLPLSEFENLLIFCRPLSPTVPAFVVISSVSVSFPIFLVVLILIADQIFQGVAIVSCHEIDAVVRAPVMAVDVL